MLVKEKISSTQLTFLIIGVTVASSVILNPGNVVGKDAWLANIAGFIEGLAFVFIQLALVLRFPGKSLIEITEYIFGSYLGKVISIAYIWFFVHLAALVLRDFMDFFSGVIYPETPIVAIGFAVIIVSFWAVKSGIEVITRSGVILVSLFVVLITISTTLNINNFELSNLLPFLDAPIGKFLKASHGVATFPYAEFIVFTMIICNLNKIKEARASVLKGLSIVCVILVIITIGNVGLLGLNSSIVTYPIFVAVRIIDIGQALSGFEILVAINFITLGFIKISAFYYAAVLGTAQLFKLRSYLPMTLPFGALILAYSIYVTDSYIALLVYASEIWPYYSLIIKVILPLVSLIIAIIRKLPKKESVVLES